MKNYIVSFLVVLLTSGCTSQEKKNEVTLDSSETMTEEPKGSWEVNKEFDEEGNLIRYDSIYSWSSGQNMDKLSSMDRDSVLGSLQSRFYQHFTNFDLHGGGLSDLFAEDSLFTRRYFNDDFFQSEFGRDFMDIDKMQERMEAIKNEFLKKYQSNLDGSDKGSSGEKGE